MDKSLWVLKIMMAISVVSSLVTLGISKKYFLALVVFSSLANASFLFAIGSDLYQRFGMEWMKYFATLVWPPVNMFLIMRLALKDDEEFD